MKIFSNFDTRAPLEAYQKALAEYGADKVIFVRRHRIYLLFFVTLPSIVMGLVLIVATVLRLQIPTEFIESLAANILFTIVFGLIALMAIIRIILNYINYLLDYTIVTPRIIMSYNQT